jgi:DNA (cytosine-5)-methyltransferase 1
MANDAINEYKCPMPYIENINQLLKPKITERTAVLDLFAGCGGLALGFEAAGYETIGYEMEQDYSRTYSHNLTGVCNQTILTPASEFPKAEILIGGPPCQPFSVGGKQSGLEDSRDGFPAFIAAVKKVEPEIWLFENVRGLLYRNKWYFDEVIKELGELDYQIEFKLMNVVNYGVPQNRERVIVVGHRGVFNYPKPSLTKVTAGEALGEWLHHAPEESKFLTPGMDKYIAKYEKASQCINPRDLYPHKPARTLTCRNLAGATGDMQRIRLADGRRRRMFVREAARLQSFPDWFEFQGTENSQFYQVGNAVPPLFSYALAQSVKKYMQEGR